MEDNSLQAIFAKIDAKTVTCDDFNALIAESIPPTIRDRVRRRTIKNTTDSHQEPVEGHQQLDLPTFSDRVDPKRRPLNKQAHGRGGLGHDHSTRTQRRLAESIDYINANLNKPVTSEMIRSCPDRRYTTEIARRLMQRVENKDWFYQLVSGLNDGR